MTRRKLLRAGLIALASLAVRPCARAADKTGPLEVTYYYLPG